MATQRENLYCWSCRLLIRSVSLMWRGYFATSVLTPWYRDDWVGCCTATIWQVFNTGETPAIMLLWAKALWHCHEWCLNANIWVELLCDCSQSQLWHTLKYFCPAPHFPLLHRVFCALTLYSSYFLHSWCSLLFPSIYCPVSPSISNASSGLCFSQNTALSPAIIFQEPAACYSSCLQHQGLDWAEPCSQGGYWLPHCLGEKPHCLGKKPSVSAERTGSEGPPGLGGSLLRCSSRAWNEREREREAEKKWDRMSVCTDSSRHWWP